MRAIALLGLLCACSASHAAGPDAVGPDAAPPSGPNIVNTDRGAVRGHVEGNVVAWRGIPYAAPPVGDLRWALPQAAPAWDGIRDGASWSSGCIEMATSGVLLDGSEDCLYLNVWAPAQHAGPLPVLVFVHGGFFLRGSASHVISGARLYDGSQVAAKGPAIVVTINYRLGALGFFQGNWGIADQIAALGWVQRNIAGFGGDPAHVMVYGESAGGYSVCELVASPKAHGLFSSAIIESGGCGRTSTSRLPELDQALLQGLGCTGAADPLACARAASGDRAALGAAIDLTMRSLHWGPRVDGDIIPIDSFQAIQTGAHNHVPLIIGNTADEYSTLINDYLATPVTTDAAYRAQVAQWFPTIANGILQRYPSSAYPSPQRALIAMMSDYVMICPARRIARAAHAAQSEPVRRYMFDHVYESGPWTSLGAGHGLDLAFEFGNLGLYGFTANAAEHALSDSIIGYWTRFAATGDPDGAGAVPWPAYDSATDPALLLDDTTTATTGVHSALCDYWDAISG